MFLTCAFKNYVMVLLFIIIKCFDDYKSEAENELERYSIETIYNSIRLICLTSVWFVKPAGYYKINQLSTFSFLILLMSFENNKHIAVKYSVNKSNVIKEWSGKNLFYWTCFLVRQYVEWLLYLTACNISTLVCNWMYSSNL